MLITSESQRVKFIEWKGKAKKFQQKEPPKKY